MWPFLWSSAAKVLEAFTQTNKKKSRCRLAVFLSFFGTQFAQSVNLWITVELTRWEKKSLAFFLSQSLSSSRDVLTCDSPKHGRSGDSGWPVAGLLTNWLAGVHTGYGNPRQRQFGHGNHGDCRWEVKDSVHYFQKCTQKIKSCWFKAGRYLTRTYVVIMGPGGCFFFFFFYSAKDWSSTELWNHDLEVIDPLHCFRVYCFDELFKT